MRLSLLALGLVLAGWLMPANAQIGGNTGGGEDPVDLTFSLQPSDAKAGEKVVLTVKTEVADGWHMYSVRTDGEIAYKPTALSLTGDSRTSFEVIGASEEGDLHDEYDDLMMGQIREFKNSPTYTFTLKALKPAQQLTGELNYQVCTDAGKCIFKTEEFSQTIAVNASADRGEAPTRGGETPAGVANAEAADSAPAEDGTSKESVTESAGAPMQAAQYHLVSDDVMPPGPKDAEAGANAYEGKEQKKGLFLMFLGALGAGVVALFTPCVFPLIPMTVSFFTKRSASRRRGLRDVSIYVVSIILTFVVVGLAITGAFGEEALYAISTNPYVNLVFFLLLVFFALSFFGMFDIQLPSSWTTKMDKMSDRGGILGIYFMALTLVIASFSCTGPLVGGALVAVSSSGELLGPVVLMSGFSMGFAIPFGIFAAFPGMMQSMPKSGGWLNSVKVTLGFLELALAFKFLSIADLKWESHILDRDVFLAIWVTIFALLGLYLLGKIRLPHDTPLEKISVPRMLLALFSFAFVVYLMPGLFGAPLPQLSGYLPPPKKSLGVFAVNAGGGTAGESGGSQRGKDIIQLVANGRCPTARMYQPALGEHTPKGFCAFYDLAEARQVARELQKPLFVDFTGVTCANCRKMEHAVWPDEKVKTIIQEDYVMVSLFVDRDMPLSNPIEFRGKEIETYGEKWNAYQAYHFDKVSQPNYALLDPVSMRNLAPPRGYDENVETYVKFLERGLKNHKKLTLEQANRVATSR